MVVEPAPPPVRVEVLGPLRLLVGGVPVDVPGPKRRAVLALLALAEGRTVTVDRLLNALWPSDVPDTGRQALQNHVSRLRGHLGAAAARLETLHDGYRLNVGRDGLDLTRARELLAAARELDGRDPVTALALLREAHALWRGPVLADLTEVLPIAAAIEESARLRREIADALIDAAVAAGEAGTVLGLASESLAEEPLREPAVVLLMRALAATGQAAEALRAGREYRHRLAEETGLDPSPILGELERGIASGQIGPVAPRREPAVPERAQAPPEPPAEPEPARRPGAFARHWHAGAPATRLIGRDAQIAALHRLLHEERLVTLVGPGGVGKTRVALEVARQTATATVLLLAPVTEPGAIPYALAAALDLEVARGDVLAACLTELANRQGLLVVDNCEHLLDAARDLVGVILSRCPGITVLATSREPLGLPAETTSRLTPLPLPGPARRPEAARNAALHTSPAASPDTAPETAAEVARVPSVALFLDRARRVRPGAEPSAGDLLTVAEIVRRLDGMPLAIELAAGRLSTFSLGDLRDRLDRSLDLLGGGRASADSRHRTLRATVEWSYRLLDEDERRLFRHLSVFADGFDLESAERIAGDLGLPGDPGSLLARLVDASMVDVDFAAGARYRMLETLRAFGADRLAAAGERDEAERCLIGWAVELTGRIGADVVTEREPEADALLRREMPNLRVAWRLARARGDLDAAAAMVTVSYDSVVYRDLIEIREWAEELADDAAIMSRPWAAALLGTAAEAAYHRGDHDRAVRLARAGLDLTVGREDKEGVWRCRMALSVVALARGAYAETVEHALAATAGTTGAREMFGIAALAAAYGGDLKRARELNDGGRAGAVSPSMISWGAYVAGEIDSLAGHGEQAERHYRQAVEQARRAGATFVAGVATVGLLSVRAAAGHVHEALGGYREVIDYFARTGNWPHLWVTLRNLATLLRRLGDDEPAALLDAAADAAPDAPAVGPAPADGHSPNGTAPEPDRAAVLGTARRAIERNLARRTAG